MAVDTDLSDLNRETARIRWRELQTHFAAGRLVLGARELDLLQAAQACARDDSAQVAAWMHNGQLGPVSDDQARQWQAEDAQFWALVIKPWVLIQPVAEDS